MDQSNFPETEDEGKVETTNFLPESMKRGKSSPELTWRDWMPQIIASCMAYCVVIQAGVNMAYSTVLVGGLQAEHDDEIKINDRQESWIGKKKPRQSNREAPGEQKEATDTGENLCQRNSHPRSDKKSGGQLNIYSTSLVTISLPLGSLVCGPLMDRFGRKTICILTCVPSTLSWLIFTFSHSLGPIYAARTIAGISGGMSTVAIVYVIEITNPSIRAMVLCLNSVFVSLGILLTCVLALFLDWRKIAMVFTVLNTSFLFLLFIIPESPHWLIGFDNQSNQSTDDSARRTLNDEGDQVARESEKQRLNQVSAPSIGEPVESSRPVIDQSEDPGIKRYLSVDRALIALLSQALKDSSSQLLNESQNKSPNPAIAQSSGQTADDKSHREGDDALNRALTHLVNQLLNRPPHQLTQVSNGSPNFVLDKIQNDSLTQVLSQLRSRVPNDLLNDLQNKSNEEQNQARESLNQVLHEILDSWLNNSPSQLQNHPPKLLTFAEPPKTARRRRAEKYLHWLNPRDDIYQQELNRIEDSNLSKSKMTSASTSLRKGTLGSYLEAMKSPTVYKPISLLLVIFLIQQLSGAYVVIFYAISVFREIGGTFGRGLNEYGALVLLGIIRFIMSIVTSILSRKIGRRVLCIASGLGMAFSMFFSAMLIFLTSTCGGMTGDEGAGPEGGQQKWMLLVIVLFYVCMSSLGFFVIPWTLIGELLPLSFRGVGGGIMVSLAYLIMFGVIKSYPFALKAMGAQNVFFAFSGVSLFGTAIVYLFLPETLGKSLQEIEDYFLGPAAKVARGQKARTAKV